MKINWKQKLTSRKFWAAVIGFVTAVLTAFHVNDMTIEQVTAIISATAVLIAYIIGEGMVDTARAKSGEVENYTTVTVDDLSDTINCAVKSALDNTIENKIYLNGKDVYKAVKEKQPKDGD